MSDTRQRKPGRPRIIGSPEEMDRLVEEYVGKCQELGEPLTPTGMILHMGLSSRQSLDQYGERPEFHDSVKRAKLVIENQYEWKLDRDKPAGAIFALKNMGWSDRQDVEIRGSLANVNLPLLPDDLLVRIAANALCQPCVTAAQRWAPARSSRALACRYLTGRIRWLPSNTRSRRWPVRMRGRYPPPARRT